MVILKKYILPLLIIISLLGIGVHLYYKQDLENLSQDNEFDQALDELITLWQKGESRHEYAKECQLTESAFLRCNPEFLYCLAQKKTVFKGRTLTFPTQEGSQLPYQIVKGRYLRVALKNEKELVEILLEKNCHEIVLAEGEYALGPQRKKEFIWSSENRKISLDRHLVINRDVLEWMRQEKPQLYQENSKKEDYQFTTWLLPELMQEYCQFRGGEVALAHVLDAAFFYKTYDKGDKVFHRSPYPWQPKGRRNFLNELDNKDFKIDRSHCMKIPASDCREILSFKDIVRSSPTWSGAFQALGGMMEYTRNPVRPRRNLKASSFVFPMKSRWHEVGQRAYWDGKGFKKENFSFHLEDPPEGNIQFDVGFRCMREEDV